MIDTSAVIDSLKVRIEALTPSTTVGANDRFRVIAEVPENTLPARTCLITAMAGRPKFPGPADGTWETQIELETLYPYAPAQKGKPTVTQQAISDAEFILADLYLWATVTEEIHKISPELGQVSNTGDGYISASRTISIEYFRG